MKIILWCLSIMIFTGSANATVIDFDELSNNSSGNGELLGDEYSSLGLEFSTSGIALNIGATVGSGQNSLGADATSTSDFDGNIVIQFLNNAFVDDLSFLIFNTPYSATAFDVAGNLLTTMIGSEFSSMFDFSGYKVNRVEVSGDFYAIDDVSFGELRLSDPSAVPVPATVWLLGVGCIGLFGSVRKRSNRHRCHALVV